MKNNSVNNHQTLRNEQLIARYRALTQAHPEWKIKSIIDILSEEFFLSERRVFEILSAAKIRTTGVMWHYVNKGTFEKQ